MMAARKASQGYAGGFTRLVYKLAVIVRSLFNRPELHAPLQPYFALTQAVRNGDLVQFDAALQADSDG